ncbi:undecaprenyldiphospho-muramoylpentapeptide beta-N-acetylglucosaminyltransferase [Weissella diestrammenae]|uniref:UDP-N-acetylglucosamine--N-acetylmuramyl-(pentapeptide) pyrophosphoryl-undecaprenol N-acetylglucosamine transferase n=1 Tax=Weissella diestrammenae TaxID=1162633 RepID=A0A7G9T636_9LACO|nr:undecaprenyldiphospho-muramoylpentapeptide beta-N-acetylglucosaminyltransferase [Weissella diestrammenae]MCM0582397.1 undecaprenyldiphospho-muramoylpentapeptide beta-N-acetylglucosaminyltransferase [Weissella diestrammenae]QNN75561.1 undecaprenyldiphospho-muramoylpentapeptide beta-N-acetylglucosaminyltransferase [Weissella diestrammenae]
MKVVFSGGGTGGHIYPALATIDEWLKRDTTLEVRYIGGERGLEKEIVPAAGIKFDAVAIQGFVRALSLQNVKTVYLFLKAVKRAKRQLRTFQPDVVVGTGGYVSGPVLYAAQLLGIPTVIHEQNSVVGVSNRFLARHATKIGVAFPAARSQFKQATVVGNPRAQQVVAGQKDNRFDFDTFGLKNDQPTVLIFGGSQGAPKINQAVVEALSQFNNQNYQILFATGKSRFDEVQAMIKQRQMTVAKNIAIVPYISNMQELMPRVELVIGRAGATSMAEQTALGKPMILIPSPYVTNDHQTKNARSMADAGAAAMIIESELDGAVLFKTVHQLMSDVAKRQEMAQHAAQLGVRDAADEFIALIQSAVKK